MGRVSKVRPAAGGGRWVEVAPERLPRWLAGFTDRHGPPQATAYPDRLVLTAADGAVAELLPPPGVTLGGSQPGAATAAGQVSLPEFVAQAAAPRRLGLLLARKSALAIGVADGERLLQSKIDSWYVQGRTAAGGQSQQRFARRRTNQAAAAAGKAADLTYTRLLPVAPSLAALVTGGDRPTVEAILADPRLARLARLRADRHLPVATPNLAVLRGAVVAARAVMIHLPPQDG